MLPSRSFFRFSARNSPRETSVFYAVSFSTLALCLLFGASATAQEALNPPAFTEPTESPLSPAEIQALRSTPPPPIGPPPSSATATTATAAPVSSTAGPEVSLNGRPVEDTPRRLKYIFNLSVRGVYDDNINITSTGSTSDYYFTIEPSIFLGLGSGEANSLSLTYRPSLFIFVENSDVNSVQHVIRLTGARSFGHLSLSLSQDVQILDGQNLNSISDPTGNRANIDVGARAKHQVYTSALGASYDLTGKLFLSGGGAFSANQYESTLISSQSISGNLFLNYNYSEKLVVGVGGTGGYNTVENSSSDQTFEQANVRLSYSATAKISLSASGGIEFRQSEGNNQNTTPVFDLTASYQPFDGTSFGITGSRRTQNSATLAGQDFSETTLNMNLNQRLVQRVFVGFAFGYTNSEYFSVIDGVTATRSDNYYYIQPTVDVNVTRWWSVGAYYLHRENSSNFSFFSFQNNQVGLRTKLTF